jgi:hypothetical protein
MGLRGNGSTGWVANGFGLEADQAQGYSIFAWVRSSGSPTNGNVVTWGGAAFIHTELAVTTTPQFQYNDVDNALDDFGALSASAPSGSWQPVLISKFSQTTGTLYVNNMQTAVARNAGTLTTQTLTALYIGEDETVSNGMPTTISVAEVAIYLGPIGISDGAQLMAGTCPLNVCTSRLLCYYPLRSDLQDYGPNGNSLVGVAPVFVDHPPVQSYLDVLQPDGLSGLLKFIFIDCQAPGAWASTVTDVPLVAKSTQSPVLLGLLTGGGTAVVGKSPVMWSAPTRGDIQVPIRTRAAFLGNVQSPTGILAGTKTDILLRSAWGATVTEVSLSQSPQTPILLGLLTATGGGTPLTKTPIMWRSASQADSQLPLSIKATSATNVSTPLETSALIRRDNLSPIEFLAAVKNINYDLNVPMGWAATAQHDFIAPFASSASTRIDLVTPTELASSISSDSILPLSFSSASRQDTTSPVSFLASSKRDSISPFLMLGTSRSDRTIPIAWSSSVLTISRDVLVPITWNAPLRADVKSPIGNATAIRDDEISPISTRAAIWADLNVPTSWQSTITEATPASAVQTPILLNLLGGGSAGNVPLFWLSATNLDIVLPIEWSGSTTTILGFFNQPIEWGTTVQRDVIAPIEFLGATNAIVGNVITPIEWTALSRSDTKAPINSTNSTRIDALSPTEWLSAVQSYYDGSPFAWGAKFQSDVKAPIYSTGAIRADYLIPITWSGVVVSISTDQLSPIAWTQVSQTNALVPSESRSTARRDNLSPSTRSATIRSDVIAPLTTRASLNTDTTIPATWASSVRVDYRPPITWASGTETVLGDHSSPLSWQSAVASDVIVPLPGGQTTSFSIDASSPLAYLTTTQTDVISPLANLSVALTDASIPISWSALTAFPISLDTSVPIEWGSGVATDLSLPLSWSLTLGPDCLVPIQWGGSPRFVPAPQRILIGHGRVRIAIGRDYDTLIIDE